MKPKPRETKGGRARKAVMACAPSSSRNRPRVLIVDDSERIRRFLSRRLELDGYETESADSLADALRLLDERRFHLLVVDRCLGDGSGLDLIPAALGRCESLRIIMITALADRAGNTEALRLGAQAVVEKPFKTGTLKSVVDEVMRGAGGAPPPLAEEVLGTKKRPLGRYVPAHS